MKQEDVERYQLMFMQELSDIDGVHAVSTAIIDDDEVFLIYVTDDCANQVQERLEGTEDLPPWKLTETF